MQNLTKEQQEYVTKKNNEKVLAAQPGFDLRSRITNATGETEVQQDYFIYLAGGDRFLERPIGSGNLFFLNGEEAGRVTKDENGRNIFDQKAEHKEFKAPADEREAIANEIKLAKAELEMLEREKAAHRAEKEQAEKAQKLVDQAKAKAEAEAGKDKK